ncbi:MAG: hypothetical protein KDF60_05405 [Calditrichaeota bacterium]|nr:hypothetical protein [Calditrichota bacterium]
MKLRIMTAIMILLFAVEICAGTPDNYDFSVIDLHADNASSKQINSVPALIDYLIRPAKNNREKVRAIFRWISRNIEYDVDAFLNRKKITDDPIEVLKRGKAVCGGYAHLFKYMCLAAGIKSEVIVGWSRAFGEISSPDANHAWNAVQIDQTWYLLDVTWGAGYMNEQQQFIRKFNDHYFLTEPEQFIFDHFPEDEFWQLLNRPKSKREFNNLVMLRPAFFQNNLQVISHKKATIKAFDELEVTLNAPTDRYITAILIKDNSELDANYCFIQRTNETVTIRLRFPVNGDYTLRIFVKEGRKAKTFDWACDYSVDVSNRNIYNSPFARQFALFTDMDAVLYTPFSFRLAKQKKYNFEIRLKNAFDVAVINDEKLLHLKKDGDFFRGEFPLKKGPVRITAKIDNTNEYHWLLEYEAD